MQSEKVPASKTRKLLMAGGALAALLSSPWNVAYAQDAAVEEEEETIVVTGTRIRQANLASPVAVHTLSSDAIELSGNNNAQDMLRELPVSGIPGFTSQNSGFSVAQAGINSVDLRNLGESRNLVLLNGRRFIGGVPSSNIVDFNMIPAELIERVEVITGGASAVYGSDAVAGVINVITKSDFDGLVISMRGGVSDRGDHENYGASITMGSDFADGRGNAVLNASWGIENGVMARDRGDQGMAIDCFATGANVADQSCPAFSSFSANTRLRLPQSPTSVVSRTLVGGVVVPFSTPVHGFNRQAYRVLSVPTERFSFQTLMDYEISPSMEVFVEAIYGRTSTDADIEPFAMATDDIFPSEVFCDGPGSDSDGDGNITECFYGAPLSNPLIPAPVVAAALALPGNAGRTINDVTVGFARRLVEVGARGASADRQTFRFLTGLRGDLNEDVRYEVALNYARTTDDQYGAGQVNTSNVREALDAIDLDGNPLTTDDIVCRNETARALGCVPLDIFNGAGSITPEMLAWIDAPRLEQSVNEQTYVTAFLEGAFDVGFLPDSVGWVLGAEHRAESSANVTDALSRTGQNAANITPPTFGNFQVSEIFGELSIPLLRDLPMARDVSLNLAARQSSYARADSELDTMAYSASLEWEPVEGLRFRTQYARAVRAPNVGDLFGPPGETFAPLDDPCAGVTLHLGTPAFFTVRADPANPANVPASGVDLSTVGAQDAINCYADPLVQARVDATGGLIITQQEDQGVGGFINGGSTDLLEETADTTTYGFVWQSQFDNPWLANLVVSVDYYDIEIIDGISSLSRQTSADSCYSADVTYDPGSPFCQNVRRFSFGPSIGALEGVDGNLQNLATIETSGIDYQASWGLRFEDAGIMQGTFLSGGAVDLTLNYSHLDNYSSVPFLGASDIISTDTVGAPAEKGTARFTYRQGPLTWAWNAAYIGEVDIFGDSGYEIPTQWFHSTTVRWNITDMHEVFFSVNNVFDDYVFVGGTSGDFDQPVGWTTFSDIYDGLGRRYSVGTRLRF